MNISFEKQRERLQKDPFWDQLPTIQGVVAADNRVRKMLCLPEEFIYGWLCSIQSSNTDLITYKRKCYQLLFNFFHGTITNRKELITEKAKHIAKIEELEKELCKVPEYVQLHQERQAIKTLSQQLVKQDNSMIAEQLYLFNT